MAQLNNNKYTMMQSDFYETEASKWSMANKNYVVGSFDHHNNWKDYDEYLFKSVEIDNGMIALDFGCGPGRNIVKFANQFSRIDGVDIAQGNLDNCKIYCQESRISFTPNLYKNNGFSLDCIPGENVYDVIFSTIAMQHICVYDIRKQLFTDMLRLLKPGGALCFQMGYGYDPKSKKKTIPYFDNYFDANTTNSGCDVRVDNVSDLRGDLSKIGFNRFQYNIRAPGPGKIYIHRR